MIFLNAYLCTKLVSILMFWKDFTLSWPLSTCWEPWHLEPITNFMRAWALLKKINNITRSPKWRPDVPKNSYGESANGNEGCVPASPPLEREMSPSMWPLTWTLVQDENDHTLYNSSFGLKFFEWFTFFIFQTFDEISTTSKTTLSSRRYIES